MATDERLELLSLLLQVVSGVGQRTAERLDRHGLTTVDLDVLVGLPPAGESENEGDDDRRITHVELSPAGRSLLDAALPDHLDVVEGTLAGPLRSTGELASFTAQLRRLRDSLRDSPVEAPVPVSVLA